MENVDKSLSIICIIRGWIKVYSVLGLFGYELCKFKDVMDKSYGNLRMMLNLGLRYNNILWLGPDGSLHLPPVVLTPGMVGHIEDSVYEVCNNLDIMDVRVVWLLKSGYKNLLRRLQQIANMI